MGLKDIFPTCRSSGAVPAVGGVAAPLAPHLLSIFGAIDSDCCARLWRPIRAAFRRLLQRESQRRCIMLMSVVWLSSVVVGLSALAVVSFAGLLSARAV